MFKIRSPQFDDLKKIKEIICNNPHVALIHELPLDKLIYLIQDLIPYNIRFLPSIHIAIEEKNILGFIVLRSSSKSNNCWQIDEVFVLNEFRNKGIGEELLRYVLSVYGSHGVEHFLAEVDSQNFPALSLFHQCGFRRYAKVYFYKCDVEALQATLLLDKDFILRPQINNDLTEIEKLELASIPPDLRPALGRSKVYFKQKKNANVLIDKSRNLIIGWGQFEKLSDESNYIEILLSPGWTHLYEPFLNTMLAEYISKTNNHNAIIKAFDYLTDLNEVLTKSGFLQVEVKELLVRTIWQRVKERKAKKAKLGVPSIAPT